MLMTEGGLTFDNRWIDIPFFPLRGCLKIALFVQVQDGRRI
jgi:hypothetical protein